MKTIELTQGQVTIVDDEDFENLNQFKWFADKHPRSGDFYAARSVKTEKGWKKIRMQRIIMNVQKGRLVDHRDHNTLDNRKSNLRICTTAENCRNQRNQNGRSSKYKGVSWHKHRNKWQATIKVNSKNKFLGRFDNEDDAARAYNIVAAIPDYHGEFACLNTIE